jgi:antitoxin component YwqK of YwqJK toxin-antitoxin module
VKPHTTGWYETGEKEYEVNYKNGYKDGIESRWYKSGRKKQRVNWKNGNLEGLEMIWYETGEKSYEMHWKNGRKDGVSRDWDIFYSEASNLASQLGHDVSLTHQIRYETHYKNGKENGLRKEWNRDGRLTYEANFVNGAEEIK